MIENDKEWKATQRRIAYFQNLLAQFRITAQPEEFALVSGGYRAEIEKMSTAVLDYLTRYEGRTADPTRPDYEALESYLRSIPSSEFEVTLTFAEIQSIIRAPLPASASNYRAWWANQSNIAHHAQARAWTNAGFKVNKTNQDKDAGWIQFVRQ
jgi:hypothetical protein